MSELKVEHFETPIPYTDGEGNKQLCAGRVVEPSREPMRRGFAPSSRRANKYPRCCSGADGKHYWLTPKPLYESLHSEFRFTFDPCPFPLPDGFDGLTCEWGASNYVNPPFGSIMLTMASEKSATAWARKAIAECSGRVGVTA